MLSLAATAGDDLLQDLFELVHEVDELLRTLVQGRHGPSVQFDGTLDDLVLLFLNVLA